MSSNLTAEPVERKKLNLGTGLKFALRKIINEPINSEVEKSFIPILKGIIAATSDKNTENDANKLIDMIETHGMIYLREE